jgi:hypothetical protein
MLTGVLFSLFMLWLPAQALAQIDTSRTTLWLPRGSEDGAVTHALVESIVREALGEESPMRHIVAPGDIERVIGAGGFSLPRCLVGLDTCASPTDALFAAIGASVVVELLPSNDGRVVEVVTTVRGEETTVSTYQGRDLRANLFNAVSELTGAASLVMVRTTPVNADILVDGELVGRSPIDIQLPIGSVTISAEAEGYFAYEERLELRASERRPVNIALDQRFAEILVRSGTPGAVVRIDGGENLPLGQAHRVEPGEHTVEILATDFAPHVETITLDSAERATMSVVLYPSQEALVREDMERIRAWPLLVQFGLNADLLRDDMSGIRADAFGSEQRTECAADPQRDTCGDTRSIGHVGLNLDVIYTWEDWELGLVGVSFGLANIRGEDQAYQLQDSAELLQVTDGTRLVVRALQPGRRWLIDNHLEPFVRGGLAVAFERFDAAELPAVVNTDAHRTTWSLEAHGGLRYHINPLIHLNGQVDIGAAFGRGPSVGATIGVGINLGSPSGLDERIDNLMTPAPPAPDDEVAAPETTEEP